jgi:indole-3-glycerol phosphate synthase
MEQPRAAARPTIRPERRLRASVVAREVRGCVSEEADRTIPAVLAEIVAHKREEVDRAKQTASVAELEAIVIQEEEPRNFFAAVAGGRLGGKPAVIAEIKRQSPSAGLIRPEYGGNGFRPEDIARRYEAAGAAAISCLTDERFFGGHLSFIRRVKEAVSLPVLRKDFLIDPWQLWESRAAGADAVLLIAEVLTESQIVDMLILAQQLRLTVLLEVHEMENLLRVRPYVGFPHRSYGLLGINNRDLSTMQVDLNHTMRLAELVEDRSILVSESGIRTGDDLRRLHDVGINIVLVGEHLMRQPDPGVALAAMLREPSGGAGA